MAAHMVGRAGLFTVRNILNRSAHTCKHLLRHSEINEAKFLQRLPVLCVTRRFSSGYNWTEIPDEVKFDIDSSVTETPADTGPAVTTLRSDVDLQEILSGMQYSYEKQQRVQPVCVEQALEFFDSLRFSSQRFHMDFIITLLRKSAC